jgi:hypothetical protein
LGCQLCETRKPRRYCPGVRGDICSICCGTEREETVDCPLDCEFLEEARRREKPPDVSPDEFPNADVRVSESFLRDNEKLLLFLSGSLLQGALETPGTIDTDIQECLDALIKTHRTLESGIYYDTRPSNVLAGAIYERLRQGVQQFREDLARRTGMHTIRDADVLGILVFLQRLEIQHHNGRRKGKAFLDFLRRYFAEFQAAREQGVLPAPPVGSPVLP